MVFAFRKRKAGGGMLPFAASVLFHVHSFHLLYAFQNLSPSFVWPWMSILILILCAVSTVWPLKGKSKGKIVLSVPFWLLTAILAVFLAFLSGMEKNTLTHTVFIALVAFLYPAAALSIYPAAPNS
jgi:hypothetical protein